MLLDTPAVQLNLPLPHTVTASGGSCEALTIIVSTALSFREWMHVSKKNVRRAHGDSQS